MNATEAIKIVREAVGILGWTENECIVRTDDEKYRVSSYAFAENGDRYVLTLLHDSDRLSIEPIETGNERYVVELPNEGRCDWDD